MSITNVQGDLKFAFSFVDELKTHLQDSVECQLEDGSILNAKSTSKFEYECDINSISNRNLTFWYKDYVGKKIKLSSNEISLYFMSKINNQIKPISKILLFHLTLQVSNLEIH